MSAKQVSKALEMSSEEQSVDSRPGTNKEWLVLLQKLKGQDEYSKFLALL